MPVYNLEAEGDHTYFVGTANGGVWVHNLCDFNAIGDLKTLSAYLKQNFLNKSEAFYRGNQIGDVGRLVETYGGQAKNWMKMKNFIQHPEGGKFSEIEIHWYENVANGIKVEFKSKWP